MTTVGSLVLFAGDVERTVGFYRALGVPLANERHDDSEPHAAVDLDGVHVAVYPGTGSGQAPGRRETGSTFAGFFVADLDAAAQRGAAAGGRTLSGHEVMAWGCRVVLEDPDGRAVEINAEGHCPAEE